MEMWFLRSQESRNGKHSALHLEEAIFWLTRDLKKLPTDGRPFSQMESLERMFEVREPLYRQFADAVISNDGTLEQTLAGIRQKLEETV